MRKRRQPSEPGDPWDASDPALALALQQMRWYAQNRDRSRWAYRISELLILLATATTTVAAALKASAWVTASLAASTVVLTGLHKIFDMHESWVASGTAWAELQVAVNDYRLTPADRRDDDARRLLIAKVNEVISTDTGRWASRRRSLAERSE
jgi:hypothetical protein